MDNTTGGGREMSIRKMVRDQSSRKLIDDFHPKCVALWMAVAILVLFIGLPHKTVGQVKFPEKPITLICPFGAGGGTDIFARSMLPFVSKHLGVQVVVENVPGGDGVIGYTKLYGMKPDGYTLSTCNWPDIFTNKIMFNPAYEGEKFTPVAAWANMPMVLATHAETFADFNQFLETARKRKVSMGEAGGVGSTGWVLTLAVEKGAGIEFNKVPYSQSGAVPVAVAGKHIDAMIGVSSAITSFVKSGQLKVLVVLHDRRDLLYPDVPTAKELGHKFETFPMLRGVIGPPNIPADRLKILETAFLKAVSDPEYTEMSRKMNIIVDPLSSVAFGRKMKEAMTFLEPFAGMLKKK